MVFLSFTHPTSSYCFIPVDPCHIMIYRELNPDILSSFSGFSLSDSIYVFPKFYLGVLSTLDIIQNFQVRLFDLRGAILTLLESLTILCMTSISKLTALPTNISSLSFLAMDRVTRYLLSVQWLPPPHP